MAIYHLSGQVISRASSDGKIRSVIACAAYRSGEKLFDERQNETKFYKKEVSPILKILAPKNAPDWVYNRETLWNEVEKSEKRYDSQLAREFNVALPIELTNEEQEKLAYKFCQKAFVDRGMVADICIHRNNKENPHFHVMLTIRPFTVNGEWGAKSKQKYSFDKDGNRIRQENGRYKSIKVKTTDWNKKDTMIEWRKQWEVMTNEILKMNGINTCITSESFKSLGNDKTPEIHEGYAARVIENKGNKSEKINQNILIKEYNNSIIDLEKYKQVKQINDNYKNFNRNFSPDEKRILKNAAKELKMYINYENVNKRLEQLEKWKKSLNFKSESIDKKNKVNRLDKEEEILCNAADIIEIEADRFLNKNYSELDVSKFNIDEKIEIVNKTIDNKNKLNSDEIKQSKDIVKENNSKKILNDIFRNNTRFTMSIQNDIKNIEETFNKLIKKYNIDFSKSETVYKLSEKMQNDMEKMFYRKSDLIESLKIMNTIYDSELKRMYPTWDGIANLKIEEKELFIMSKEYFGKTLMPEDMKIIPTKYNPKQQEEILNILDTKNNKLLKEKYPDFKINEAYKNMFYLECYSNTKLNIVSRNLVKNYFNKDNFMDDYNVFENVNQIDRGFVNSKGERSLLFEFIGGLIDEIDERVQENSIENDIKKRKSQRQHRRQSQDFDDFDL